MSGKIVFWADEDERIWLSERWLLEGLGMSVDAIPDATTALKLIEEANQNEVILIILDVMLLQGDDLNLFSDTATRGGLRTGLVLAKCLTKNAPHIGSKILFFSRVTDRASIAEIEKTAKDIGAHYLAKNTQTQGRHFIRWLREKGFLKEL